MARINWIPIGSGYIAIGHKPGGRISFEGLKNAGTSLVLTLLLKHEGAQYIGDQLKQLNIDWIWFPFSAANPHTWKKLVEVQVLFEHLNKCLQDGGKIYIHCSGGIHRTGMVTYGLLRYLGKGKEDAVKILKDLRVVTALNIKDKLLLWGDQFYNKITE